MTNEAFNRKKTLSLQQTRRKKLVKCYIVSIALYGAGTWTLQKVCLKYLLSLEILCWRRMQMISWTDHVRNGEVFLKKGVGKANWVNYILHRNSLLKHVTEGKIERMI
jgi:hypothetical protein